MNQTLQGYSRVFELQAKLVSFNESVKRRVFEIGLRNATLEGDFANGSAAKENCTRFRVWSPRTDRSRRVVSEALDYEEYPAGGRLSRELFLPPPRRMSRKLKRRDEGRLDGLPHL